jgi:hypothetical protein
MEKSDFASCSCSFIFDFVLLYLIKLFSSILGFPLVPTAAKAINSFPFFWENSGQCFLSALFFLQSFLFFRSVRTPRLSSSGKSWSFLFSLRVLQPASASGFCLLFRCSRFSLTHVSAGFHPHESISCHQATRGSP